MTKVNWITLRFLLTQMWCWVALVSFACVMGSMLWTFLAPPTYVAALRQKGIPTNDAECAELYERGPREENGFRYIFPAASQLRQPSEEVEEVIPFAGNAKLPVPPGPFPHAMGQPITEYVQANAEALETLHRALEFPRIRAPIIFNGNWTKLPHLARIRWLANLLALETLSHIYAGRPQETTDSLVNLFHLSLSTAGEPIQITPYGQVRTALDTFEAGAGRMDFTLDQLRCLQDAISQNQFQEFNTVRFGKLGEASAYLQYHNVLYSNIGEHYEVTPQEYISVSLGFTYMRACGLELFDRLTIVNHARQMVEAGEHMNAKTLKSHIERDGMGLYSRNLFGTHIKVFSYLYLIEAETIARARAALVVCAIERYQLDNDDALPDRLDVLVPEYLEHVPLDPYDDLPLRYRFIEDYGYMIYSIGYNRRDDRGAVVEGRYWREGDIVTAVYPLSRDARVSDGKPALIPPHTDTAKLRVEIEYGKGARSLRRASSLAHELLSGFPAEIREVALQPGDAGGVFEVSVNGLVIWSRKGVGRFPAWEELKQRVRDFPQIGTRPEP